MLRSPEKRSESSAAVRFGAKVWSTGSNRAPIDDATLTLRVKSIKY